MIRIKKTGEKQNNNKNPAVPKSYKMVLFPKATLKVQWEVSQLFISEWKKADFSTSRWLFESSDGLISFHSTEHK